MARWGNCDFRQFQNLQRRLERLGQADLRLFCEKAAKELAARLLAKVIRKTPVGNPDNWVVRRAPKGYRGGTLRRGWTAKTEGEAQNGTGRGVDPRQYANSLSVTKTGNTYQIDIINPVHYASYVEYGHRKSNGQGWVEGRFMLTVAENELNSEAPTILENKLKRYLEEYLNGQ